MTSVWYICVRFRLDNRCLFLSFKKEHNLNMACRHFRNAFRSFLQKRSSREQVNFNSPILLQKLVGIFVQMFFHTWNDLDINKNDSLLCLHIKLDRRNPIMDACAHGFILKLCMSLFVCQGENDVVLFKTFSAPSACPPDSRERRALGSCRRAMECSVPATRAH